MKSAVFSGCWSEKRKQQFGVSKGKVHIQLSLRKNFPKMRAVFHPPLVSCTPCELTMCQALCLAWMMENKPDTLSAYKSHHLYQHIIAVQWNKEKDIKVQRGDVTWSRLHSMSMEKQVRTQVNHCSSWNQKSNFSGVLCLGKDMVYDFIIFS